MPERKRLNPLDGSWIMLESPETPMHVGSLQIYELPEDAGTDYIKKIFEYLRQFPIKSAPFHYRLAKQPFGMTKYNPHWEIVPDDELDVDYHVRHLALPAPGGERELGIMVSRLHSTPLHPRRPMWEFSLIEGLDKNRFAVYIKAHHAIMDGVASIKILQDLLSENPNKRDLVPVWAQEKNKQKKVKAHHNIQTPIEQAMAQIKSQMTTVSGVFGSIKGLAMRALNRDPAHPDLVAPYTAPATILNVPIGGQRRFATFQCDIARMKKLAKNMDGTLNDAVLAVCSGALRRYLIDQNALPEKPLITNMPVSIRPKDDENAGNAISFMFANLGTHLEHAESRVDIIKRSTHAAKEHLQAMPRDALNLYTTLVMAPFTVGQLTGLTSFKHPMFNVVISNVPGPKKTLYFNGAKLDGMFPISLMSNGQALNITILTYADSLTFSFTACRTSVPSVQRLAVYSGESLEELEEVFG